MKTHFKILQLIPLLACLSGYSLLGAKPAVAPLKPPLTEAGSKLEAQYAAELNELKSGVRSQLVGLDDAAKSECAKAFATEASARTAFMKARGRLVHLNWLRTMLAGGKKGVEEALVGITAAEAKHKEAKDDAHRDAASREVTAWQGKKSKSDEVIRYFEGALAKEAPKEPAYQAEMKTAEEAYAKARTAADANLEKIGIAKWLGGTSMDGKLAKLAVMQDATPYGLADYAQAGKAQQDLIQSLLADEKLLLQIAVADGAKGGHYGKAMEIYSAIRKASSKVSEGTLQRLALAVALEHAQPIGKKNSKAEDETEDKEETGGGDIVDPVKRYLYYEKAFLDGELDPGFKGLSVFDLRLVVYGQEPEELLTWGRETLRNFRPDHVMQADQGWRYTRIVSTDVSYGSSDVRYDKPELHFFQNILMNGGICGRRAFFGRFMLRAWGIPNIARPSKAHAALARWTPDGWVVCLGPKWGSGKAGYDHYPRDVDFLATTQARADEKGFLRIKRAYWLGLAHDESLSYGEGGKNTGFWSTVALRSQRLLIEDNKAKVLDAVGEDLGEADASEEGSSAADRQSDEKITTGSDGVITIPASLYEGSGKGVISMQSFSGGRQIYLGRFGHQGTTIMRGGAIKSLAETDFSGNRVLSDGRGAYDNWGFRAAMSSAETNPPAEITLDLGNGVKMEMVYIRPGKFIRGGESTEDGRFKCVEVPKREVEITKGYYLGKTEVTQAQFQAVTEYNTSRFVDPNNPVDTVSQGDAFKFCEMLAAKTGKEVRLPTEAEWEYASRAGSKAKWFFGDDASKLVDYAWFGANSEGKTHPVAGKKPNAWGLFDMYGNVFERVADVYARDFYAQGPVVDPFNHGQSDQSVIEYTVEVPASGTYALSALVVTVNENQRLQVAVNGSQSSQTLQLPFTIGKWQDSEPIKVELKQGRNTLKLWRSKPPQKGIAIKSFSLKRGS